MHNTKNWAWSLHKALQKEFPWTLLATVREDLDAIGHAYDWWKKCNDREEWRSIIQVLLDVPSP